MEPRIQYAQTEDGVSITSIQGLFDATADDRP
jgi:hypothetical protein